VGDTVMLPCFLWKSQPKHCDAGRLGSCNANWSAETEIKALLCHSLCV